MTSLINAATIEAQKPDRPVRSLSTGSPLRVWGSPKSDRSFKARGSSINGGGFMKSPQQLLGMETEKGGEGGGA